MAKKAGLIWIDAQGQRVLHVITTGSGVGPIETALANHSNAGVLECWEGLDENMSPTPSTSPLPTVRSTVQLNFRNMASGSRATLFLPAPQTNIFLTDGTTVDPSLISDIISAAEGNLLAGDGSLVDDFTGGQLIPTRFSGIETITP